MGNEIKPGMMKYCVVGTIVKERIDENGATKYGTASFPGGRKVYISRRVWKRDGIQLVVLGRNRFNKYTHEIVPLSCVENIRATRTFKPHILELMKNTEEFPDMWWLYKDEDKTGSEEFVRMLNRTKDGDTVAFDEYDCEIMSRFQ